ncbi:protein of unknown function [Candidatus Filomicrobium marinum]|uniref:Uncharacterized protein n=1 Tax=Candidatus Filomicrobium marinum TaxID=1608628 RepID=A0A0D6JID8_9HYPH|nr:protein of unknown function [Candidatus Filomicrobium marinum]CPR21764.1 protein of unknown function [Candidatus Filomicrobium marinum]
MRCRDRADVRWSGVADVRSDPAVGHQHRAGFSAILRDCGGYGGGGERGQPHDAANGAGFRLNHPHRAAGAFTCGDDRLARRSYHSGAGAGVWRLLDVAITPAYGPQADPVSGKNMSVIRGEWNEVHPARFSKRTLTPHV